MSDMFDDFEFKPLTEGLGFHKKAQDSNSQRRQSQSQSNQHRQTPVAGRALSETKARSIFSDVGVGTDRSERVSVGTRSFGREIDSEINRDFSGRDPSHAGTQSISDLIASLPPSLDFIEEAGPTSTSHARGSGTSSAKPSFNVSAAIESTESYMGRPQIFQPLAREDYKTSNASSLANLANPANPLSHSIATTGPTIGTVLPSPGTKAGGAMVPSAPVVPTLPGPTHVKPSSPYRERLDESFARAFPHAEKQKATSAQYETENLQPVSAHFGAAILDAMVVGGLAMIMLVCILAITRINLVGLLTNAKTDGPTQINLALLFVVVLQLYMFIARSFFGASLGEWAFEIQLGRLDQQRRLIYPFQVAWRSVLVAITGLIVLPLLSVIFRRDLSQYLTGIGLYRRV